RELGRGGMGVVLEALDQDLGRPVALKLLRESAPNESGTTSREEEERFVLEARLTANLPRHPHLVSVYEAGLLEGQQYIAMEYIQGRDFSQWRRGDSVQLRDQVAALRDIASAVAHAHGHGVIHRDLKPANVLVDTQGVPHVTDFGIARRMNRDTLTALTVTGVAMGTPSYMSPEQAAGRKDLDLRTDVWSLGIMLYEILTNRLPFEGETALEILLKTVNDPVPRPCKIPGEKSSPALRDLEKICLRALEKDVRDRTPSAAAFSDDLARWLRGENIRTHLSRSDRRRHLLAGAAILGILGTMAGTAYLGPGEGQKAAEREVRRARQVSVQRPGDLEGQLDAWKKAQAAARGTSFLREATTEHDAALSRVREVIARDLAGLDLELAPREADLNYGDAKELLTQARAKHAFSEWMGQLDRRERDLGRLLDRDYANIKERIIAAQRRGDVRAVEACKSNVIHHWRMPALEKDLEQILSGIPLGKITIDLPPPAGAIELAPIRGHLKGLESVAFSPDGKSMLTSSYDKSLKLWDLAGRTERATLFKGEECNRAVFSPDGRWIAAGFWDSSVRIWDAQSLESRTLLGHRLQVRSVVFSRDSSKLASGSTDRSIRISDVSTKSLDKVFEELPRGVMSLAISGDNRVMAAGCGSGEVRVWDFPEGRTVRTLDHYAGGAVALAVDPRGEMVLAGYMDGRIVHWDPATGRATLWPGHQSEVRDLTYSPDGKLVASASTDGSLRLWDAKSGECLGAFQDAGGFYAADFSREGNLLAGASGSRIARLWDITALRDR
ncbi:MAG TPA: serine/threonine-protein kinase, partial [Planctomycetota bacterium]|nr:serine/threonine-protein kinase [Planctomycetota bacterium]